MHRHVIENRSVYFQTCCISLSLLNYFPKLHDTGAGVETQISNFQATLFSWTRRQKPHSQTCLASGFRVAQLVTMSLPQPARCGSWRRRTRGPGPPRRACCCSMRTHTLTTRYVTETLCSRYVPLKYHFFSKSHTQRRQVSTAAVTFAVGGIKLFFQKFVPNSHTDFRLKSECQLLMDRRAVFRRFWIFGLILRTIIITVSVGTSCRRSVELRTLDISFKFNKG